MCAVLKVNSAGPKSMISSSQRYPERVFATQRQICYIQSAFDCPAIRRRASSNAFLLLSAPNSPLSNSEEITLKNIFVGNLDFGTTEDSIRALFEPYGTVERVSIVNDRD